MSFQLLDIFTLLDKHTSLLKNLYITYPQCFTVKAPDDPQKNGLVLETLKTFYKVYTAQQLSL